LLRIDDLANIARASFLGFIELGCRMERSAGSTSIGSWQASIQFHTLPGTAWRRHIAAIAMDIAVASPTPYSQRHLHGKQPPTP
jgi:hypothetical protein